MIYRGVFKFVEIFCGKKKEPKKNIILYVLLYLYINYIYYILIIIYINYIISRNYKYSLNKFNSHL